MRNDIPNGEMEIFRFGLVLTGADSRQFLAKSTCSGQQEVSRPASWIAYGHAENRANLCFLLFHQILALRGLFGLGDTLLHYGNQGALYQLLNQFWTCVIRARGFALRARTQIELHPVVSCLENWLIIEQAFVDGTQLLHIKS